MKTITLIGAVLCALVTNAQIDTAVWKVEKKIEDNRYVLNLPNDWKKVPLTEGSGLEYKFELTGIGITTTSNSAPVTAFFTITRTKGNDLKAAREAVINEFMVFNDRVMEPNYQYDSTTLTIRTKQTGDMLHTRYYRRSKVSNYSRYYFNIYSEKADAVFTLTMTFQYKDARYDLERSNRFREYAERTFRNMELR